MTSRVWTKEERISAAYSSCLLSFFIFLFFPPVVGECSRLSFRGRRIRTRKVRARFPRRGYGFFFFFFFSLSFPPLIPASESSVSQTATLLNSSFVNFWIGEGRTENLNLPPFPFFFFYFSPHPLLALADPLPSGSRLGRN